MDGTIEFLTDTGAGPKTDRRPLPDRSADTQHVCR